jgi:hypothetical protein
VPAGELVDRPGGQIGLLQRLDGRGVVPLALVPQALCELVARRGELVRRKAVEAVQLFL